MVNSKSTCRIEKSQRSHFPVRADTAVRPYAEDLFQEEASPQPKRKVVGICVTSGDLGTYGMHPPSERYVVSYESGITAIIQTVTFSCAGGHSGPPLRGHLSLATRTGLC